MDTRLFAILSLEEIVTDVVAATGVREIVHTSSIEREIAFDATVGSHNQSLLKDHIPAFEGILLQLSVIIGPRG